MRHTFVIATCLLLAASTSFAQPASDQTRPGVGVEGGLAAATLSSYQTPDGTFETGFRQGAMVGAFAQLPFGHGLSLRPGVYFVQKGAAINVSGSADDVATVDLEYVEIAVLARLTREIGSIRPFVNAGPAFGIKTSATVDASASGGASNIDVGSQVRTAAVDLAVGGGVQHRRLSVEARFVQGLLDIGNTRLISEPVRTRTLAILAGIRF